MRALALSILLALAAAPALAGTAPNLNGTWQGSITCKGEDSGGKQTLKTDPSTLGIIQAGPTGPLLALLDSTQYSGTFAASLDDPREGVGALIACGTNDGTVTSSESTIHSFHYKLDSSGGGTIKAEGVFVVNGIGSGTCKGSWRRTGPFLGKLGGCAP